MQEPKPIPDVVVAERQTEITILGAAIVSPEVLTDAIEQLDDIDFYLDSHQRIFRALCRMRRDGREIDVVTLDAELRSRVEIEAIGGSGYLGNLLSGIPRNPAVGEYIRIIKEKASLRQVFNASTEAAEEIAGGSTDAKEIIARQIATLQTIQESTRDTSMEHFGAFMVHRYKHEPESIFTHSAKLVGVNTGLDQFDSFTSTLQPKDLWVIAARPSMGKTAAATSIIKNIVLAPFKPKTVAAFFLEQSKTSAMGRLLCGTAEASFKRFRDGCLYESEKRRVRQAIADFAKAPLFWDKGDEDLTVGEIHAKCRRLKREVGLDIIFIDQLSFIDDADVYRKGMRGDEIVGKQMRAIKGMAKDLDVPVVLMAQIGRGATKNKDSRPTLADLADSGKIEQHADGIAFLHRAEYYDRNDEELVGKAEIIIAKHRDGPVGTIKCEYIKDSCLWLDQLTSAPTESAGLNFRDDSY